MIPNEDWQVVKPCHLRCRAPSAAPRLYSPHYRATVEGRCLNCLSSSHRRAGCCLPTHCFNCHGLRHHLRDCKRPHKSSIVVGVSDAVSQAPRDTFVSLGDGGTPGTPAPSIASRFPKPDLVFPVESVCSIPRLWDPMVEEATLGTTIATPGCSFQEEITILVEQQANPPLIAMSPGLSNPLPPIDIKTPEIFRSEEEQLVTYDLIEALSKFKLSKVPPLSPSSHHESSSNFEAIVVHRKENQSSYRQRKVKSKTRKPCFKVVRDLLIKKWIVVKKDPQLCDFIELALLLETLGVP
jgi:hypothetical protein